MTHSWTEVQALGVKAASGAGVPPAQALAFGAMVARHLADGGAETPIAAALRAPDSIVALALRVEKVIEGASMNASAVTVREADAGARALLFSWLSGLPCQTALTLADDTIIASLNLAAPSDRSRPDRVPLGPELQEQMQELAAKTYVPDSDASRSAGAGAGLMDLD
ncbi:hypothetical protein [uncultured Tateyamaria sp.]|uniref:hypothetical protein n=1 Tax=uncultured Tateyamaria sp. TaxID=455651 RepID=UPI002629E5A9|nr:hypothetical protein [uncultured Tateyamaria sp.]